LRSTDPYDKSTEKVSEPIKYTGETSTLEKAKIASNTKVVYVKDLGIQVSYRGVFLIEYAGPIVIALLYSLRPSFIFGSGSLPLDVLGGLKAYGAADGTANWNKFVHSLAFVTWVLHFTKREFERLVPL